MPQLPESLLDHLACPHCGAEVPVDRLHNLCPCGSPLFAHYRVDPSARFPDPAVPGMWRYAALLPHRGDPITLAEGYTPIVPLPRLARAVGVRELLAKDESRNPNTSFKSRGLSAAVTMAKALGARRLAIPTAGNAGGALAAYGARAGLPVDVFLPADTPEPFLLEAQLHGATVHRVDGLIDACGRLVGEGAAEGRWFDVSTLKEPYRLEGKKTMGFELWEQGNGSLPDVILYPTGGGTGLIGIWKALAELEARGILSAPKPRMFAVQTEGCAPIVQAFESGAEVATPWENATTLAYGLRVPRAVGDRLMLQLLRESNGGAVAVSEQELLDGMKELAAVEGLPAGPEGGALLAAARRLHERNEIDADSSVLLLCTGSGHKYLDALRAAVERP